MNIVQLKKAIIENSDNYIPVILEKLNCINIQSYPKEYRFSDGQHSSSNGIRIYKSTLHTKSYYDSWEGDLITLVIRLKNCTFKQAIDFICQWVGIDEAITKQEILLPFGGYYKGIKVDVDKDEPIPTYDESVLDKYLNIPNQRFLKDGISLQTQLKYGIRYDLSSDRIVIPWYDIENELIGIMARYNGSTKYMEENNIAKYYPIIPFPKSKAVYGLNHNYNSILKQEVVIIGESEKHCGQLDSMGLEVGVSVGSHNISDEQIKLIHSMFPKQIIVAFDEGISKEELEQTCKRLRYTSGFYQCKVGYIYDVDGTYLQKGKKQSPTDLGKDVFKELMYKCLTWTN